MDLAWAVAAVIMAAALSSALSLRRGLGRRRRGAGRIQVADILEEFNPVHVGDGTETDAAPISTGAERGEYAPAVSSQTRTAEPEPTTGGEPSVRSR